MRLSEIEKKAKAIGIKDTWRLSKKELVRTIQRTEGYSDCFASERNYCDQSGCSWRSDCQR